MRSLKSPRPNRALLLGLLLAVVACGDSPSSPGIEPQIVNDPDTFSYQVSDLRNVSRAWEYNWSNSGTTAKVTHASDAGASGTATLTIRDADDTEVYSGVFATTGEEVTSPAGVAGSWTIRVAYTNYTNTQVNFAVIKQ